MAGVRIISPAYAKGTDVPAIEKQTVLSGQTFKRGALLILDATTGFVKECAATPTAVYGVALADASSAPGYNAANSPLVITGQANIVSVGVADMNTTWSMRGANGATDPTTPVAGDIGDQYGAIKDANGVWTLDLSNTTQKVFTIVGIDIDLKIYFCRFISSVPTT